MRCESDHRGPGRRLGWHVEIDDVSLVSAVVVGKGGDLMAVVNDSDQERSPVAGN